VSLVSRARGYGVCRRAPSGARRPEWGIGCVVIGAGLPGWAAARTVAGAAVTLGGESELDRGFDGQLAGLSGPFTFGIWHGGAPDPPRNPDPPRSFPGSPCHGHSRPAPGGAARPDGDPARLPVGRAVNLVVTQGVPGLRRLPAQLSRARDAPRSQPSARRAEPGVHRMGECVEICPVDAIEVRA